MKRVYIQSVSPMAVSKEAEVGWDDVWLRVKSGRRTLRLAPTLVSRENLLSDLDVRMKALEEGKEWARQDVADLEEALRGTEAAGYFVDQALRTARRGRDPGHAFALAHVYTSRPWITRAEAESMLDFYLGAVGLRRCAYKWKHPKLVVWPVTVRRA